MSGAVGLKSARGLARPGGFSLESEAFRRCWTKSEAKMHILSENASTSIVRWLADGCNSEGLMDNSAATGTCRQGSPQGGAVVQYMVQVEQRMQPPSGWPR